jgi:photosystem II stability/assembly factor-like uncharacterized protein
MKKVIVILIACFFSNFLLHAQWQKMDGPNGDYINAFAINGASSYAVGIYGIYHSANNGKNWTLVNNSLVSFGTQSIPLVNALAVNDNKLFASTASGVFMSENNGINWTEVNRGFDSLNSKSIYGLFVSNSKIMAVTNNEGLFLTLSNGGNWTAINEGLPFYFENGIKRFYNSLVTTSNSSKFFTSSKGGVYTFDFSTNKWVTAANLGLLETVRINYMAASETTLVISTDTGIYFSTNNGNSWTPANSGLGVAKITALHINGTKVFAGTENGVYTSSDNGNNWAATANIGLKDKYIMAITTSGLELLVSTYGKVFVSNNSGTNWSEASGLQNLEVQTFTTNGSNIYAGTLFGGIFSSANNNGIWESRSNIPTVPSVYSIVINGSDILVGGIFGPALSVNNGDSWVQIRNGMTSTAKKVVVSGANIFAVTFTKGVFLSTNNGSSWLAINNDLPFNSSRDKIVNDLAVIGSNIFVATENGVFKSTNNGNTWTQVMTSNTEVGILVVSGTRLIAAGGKTLAYSTNNGSSWTEIAFNIPLRANISSITARGSTIVVGTYDWTSLSTNLGIYLSNDNGDNWSDINNGVVPSSNAVALNGNYLYVGGTKGVWRRVLENIVDVKESKMEDLTCVVSPNPASNLLNIVISEDLIGKEYSVRNPLGVAYLKGILSDKSTHLSIKDLPNGMYILQLEGSSKTVKFMKQ